MTISFESTEYEAHVLGQRLAHNELGMTAVQRYFIDTISAAPTVLVRVETNDDDDDGYPDGEWAAWEEKFDTEYQALKHTGVSRVGISGVIVTVELNGRTVK